MECYIEGDGYIECASLPHVLTSARVPIKYIILLSNPSPQPAPRRTHNYTVQVIGFIAAECSSVYEGVQLLNGGRKSAGEGCGLSLASSAVLAGAQSAVLATSGRFR